MGASYIYDISRLRVKQWQYFAVSQLSGCDMARGVSVSGSLHEDKQPVVPQNVFQALCANIHAQCLLFVFCEV